MNIRKGSLADAETFIAFLKEVRAGMEHKDWLYMDPTEEIQHMIMDGSHEFWMAYDDGTLAAVFSVVHPGLSEMNYGYDLELTREELLRVVNMDTIAVHPKYRGRGLRFSLMQHAENDVCSYEDKILLCTVHPDNQFSLKNILGLGYTIQRKLEKYNSVRYILRKDGLKKL